MVRKIQLLIERRSCLFSYYAPLQENPSSQQLHSSLLTGTRHTRGSIATDRIYASLAVSYPRARIYLVSQRPKWTAIPRLTLMRSMLGAQTVAHSTGTVPTRAFSTTHRGPVAAVTPHSTARHPPAARHPPEVRRTGTHPTAAVAIPNTRPRVSCCLHIQRRPLR